jgi:hypothetical protein
MLHRMMVEDDIAVSNIATSNAVSGHATLIRSLGPAKGGLKLMPPKARRGFGHIRLLAELLLPLEMLQVGGRGFASSRLLGRLTVHAKLRQAPKARLGRRRPAAEGISSTSTSRLRSRGNLKSTSQGAPTPACTGRHLEGTWNGSLGLEPSRPTATGHIAGKVPTWDIPGVLGVSERCEIRVGG